MSFSYGKCPQCGAYYQVDARDSRGNPTVLCNGGVDGDCRRVEVPMSELDPEDPDDEGAAAELGDGEEE